MSTEKYKKVKKLGKKRELTLLNEEGTAKAIKVCVEEVDATDRLIEVEHHIHLEDLIRLLLQLLQILRGEERLFCLVLHWEVLVLEGRAVGVTIAIELALEELSVEVCIDFDLYTSNKVRKDERR